MAMRRQRRPQHYDDDDLFSTTYQPQHENSNDVVQMERLQSQQQQQHKFENTIEAKVEEGDTLQALALKFHCTVADIKRLNKIDKENEIHARKVVKIPVTVHSVLLETLPTVHKSGNNSPRRAPNGESQATSPIYTRNTLEDSQVILEEKLLVASVNAAGGSSSAASSSINNIALNSNVLSSAAFYTNNDSQLTDAAAPLLSDLLDETIPQLRPIRGPSMRAIDWSGSDCDMSWVCLFVVILALCFVIPLLYILYLAEHPHHHNSTTH